VKTKPYAIVSVKERQDWLAESIEYYWIAVQRVRMSRLKKVGYGTLQLGDQVPWAVYDSNGVLLLEKGEVVETETQLETLISRGIYLANDEDYEAQAGEDEDFGEADSPQDERVRTWKSQNPFAELQQRLLDFDRTMFLLSERRPESEFSVRLLAHRIISLSEDDPDACLAMLHVHSLEPTPALLSLFYATLVSIVGRSLEFSSSRLEATVAAALTANVSLLPYQEKLNQSSRGLTDKLREIINKHPLLSATLMRQCGITDTVWLQAIEQHHENDDGSGYPRGLKKDQLLPEARLISLAEKYTALVTVRGYRRRHLPYEALREILLNNSQDRLDPLCQIFYREVSRHPPGSFVKLANGETAIVIRRGQAGETPQVRAVITSGGSPYLGAPSRDTARREFGILSAVPQPETLSLDLPELWGYH